MKKIDVENWNRKKIYNWFKGFSNSTWGITKKVDVTEIVEYSRETKTSFFINMLYIVVKTLNSFDCMKMRLVDEEPIIFDDVAPAYTVMTESGAFENVRHTYIDNYFNFYALAKENIELTKKKNSVAEGDYNPVNCYNEYYITCLPWMDFSTLSHPIPDDKGSQSIPRICWGKYCLEDNKFIIDFNLTISHIFCDGYDVFSFYLKLQENIMKFRNNIY